MGDTHVSNGTPGRVFLQNLVFDNNSITPSSTVGDGNVSITTNDGNSVNLNKINVTRDAANAAVLMTSAVEDDHIVIRSSGNGNIYLGTVNSAKSTTLSTFMDKLRSDVINGTIKLDSNGPDGIINLDDRMYVRNGNVGIGVPNPDTKLHIIGDIKLDGSIIDTNGDPYIVPTWVPNGSDLYYSAGNVIVGSSSTPAGKFDIVASTGRGLLVTGDAGTSTAQASFSGSSNTMLLRAGNGDGNNYTFSVQKNDSSSVLFVGNDGLIGVGNTTPSYGLDVAVSARMDHSLVVGGTGLTVSRGGESVKLVGVSSSYIGLYPDSPTLRKGYFGYDEGVLKFNSESSSRHFNFAGGYVGLKTLTPNYDLTINAGSTDSTLSHGSHHAFGIVGSTDQETLLMGYDSMVDAGYFNVSNVDGAVPLLLQTLGGSVGIGSNSPLGRLDVRKGTAGSSGWEAASFGAETSANDLVVVGNYNNRAVIAGKNATMSGDANLVLAPSGGNVGVGAMSPAYKLDIDGNVNLTGTLYQGGNAVALSSFFQNGGNVYLNSGNFGIGTSSPDRDFVISKNTSSYIKTVNTSSNNYIMLGAGGSSSGTYLYSRQTDETTPVKFSINQGSLGDTFVLDTSGNVGIGTSSPAAGLDIAGSHVNNKGLQLRSGDTLTGTDSSQIIFSFDNGSYDNIGYSHSIRTRHNNSGSSGNAIDFWLWDHSVDTSSTLGSLRVMTLDGTGNVGIGTSSPGYNLDVVGNLNYTGNLYKNGTLVSSGSGLWTANGGDIYFSGGNVGIGTTSPSARFDIGGNTDADIQAILTRGSDPDFQLQAINSTSSNASGAIVSKFGLRHGTNETALFNFIRGNSGNDGTLAIVTDNAERMRVDSAGNIGVGTNDPKAKVHINGGGGVNVNLGSAARAYFRYNSSLNLDTNIWSMSGVSLYASAEIVAGSWIASHSSTTFSDTRIKKDIVDIDDDSALQTIRLIKPKKYSYVDIVSRGSEPVWGFIAQEVKSTLDYAVNLMEKAIPNIYCLGNVLDNGNIIEISNFNTANLQHKDDGTLITKLQLKSWDNQEIEVEINSVLSSSKIRLTKPLEENVCNGTIGDEIIENQIFVYGQYVDDFHVLKKDAIFTVGIAALQEVDRRQVADNERILELEGDVAVLQSELSTARTELDAAKGQIASMQAQIDSILASLA